MSGIRSVMANQFVPNGPLGAGSVIKLSWPSALPVIEPSLPMATGEVFRHSVEQGGTSSGHAVVEAEGVPMVASSRRENLRRLVRRLSRPGLSWLLSSQEMHLLAKGDRSPRERRRRLGVELGRRLDETVAYGPLQGVRLLPSTSWGEDRASMLLGLYEREVVERIMRRSVAYGRLVNVGAGDGLHTVGSLLKGFALSALAFEASEEGRERIAAIAALNGVADRLEIRGICRASDLLVLESSPSTLVLMDIEGGEFDVLTREVLEHFRDADLIVELHEWHEESEQGLARILADAERVGFVVTWLHTGPRDPGSIEELRTYSDDDRWAVCSEGRPEPMRWLCLTPA